MTPRPPLPPEAPPSHLSRPRERSTDGAAGGRVRVAPRDDSDLFGSGPRAADAAPAATVEGAGGAFPSSAPPAVPESRPPLGAPPLGAPHREAWRHLRAHGPYTLQHPAAGWTCWLPEDPARPALGIASAVMDTLAAAGAAAIDDTGRATARNPAKDTP